MVLKMGLEPTRIAPGDFKSNNMFKNRVYTPYFAVFLAFLPHFATVSQTFFIPHVAAMWQKYTLFSGMHFA